MKKRRLRFREFLLLTTLASLITAAFAIRARLSNHESAQAHAFQAYRARLTVKAAEGSIQHAKRKLETTAPFPVERAARCDIRLMPSVSDPREIPTAGKNLIVLADVHGLLYFRMFDGEGKLVFDSAGWMPEPKEDFKKHLDGLWPPHELTGNDKSWVISAIASIVDEQRDLYRTVLKHSQVWHAKAIAKAEQHEQLAQQP